MAVTLRALAEAGGRARSIELEIRALAARAAADGAGYGDIGRALGITRQDARKRLPGMIRSTTRIVDPGVQVQANKLTSDDVKAR
ncbi:hypothetical protein FDG2_2735 [Candidatus Protofrankia californiensis]|uniref:Uncharacterized protein n=1 Tax=Candidatus Protofrankia californiensis TaxID=1839754 RepID=A0A1C3NY89_9ACTN|nr:hypothetical protein FDG2_2735 [Candidatus Protofrankia californiensis]